MMMMNDDDDGDVDDGDVDVDDVNVDEGDFFSLLTCPPATVSPPLRPPPYWLEKNIKSFKNLSNFLPKSLI